MKQARNNIFILRIVCVCLLFTLYACKTTDQSRRKKVNEELIVPVVDNAANELLDYRAWQRARVACIDSVLPGYIDSEAALYARADTAFSAFIPAEALFKPNSSTPVKSDAAELLNQFARFMADNPDLSLLIAGHESGDKNEDYNLHLSQKRARNLLLLFNELHGNDVATSPTFSGYGSSYLKTLNNFDHNRLIEFRFTPYK